MKLEKIQKQIEELKELGLDQLVADFKYAYDYMENSVDDHEYMSDDFIDAQNDMEDLEVELDEFSKDLAKFVKSMRSIREYVAQTEPAFDNNGCLDLTPVYVRGDGKRHCPDDPELGD